MKKRKRKISEKVLMDISRNSWRNITNLWTILTIAFFIIDFFTQHKYAFSTNIISTAYITILSIYASTKEFERWKVDYKGNYMGELSAFIWTIVVIGLIIIDLVFDNKYSVTGELITTYVIVIVILAVTITSKTLYFNKKTK